MKKNKLGAQVLLISVIAFAFIVAVPFILRAATSYRVDIGATVRINEAVTGCYDVTNNSSGHIFIPTNTAGEWNAFYTNHPAGVSIMACGGRLCG